MKKGEITWYAVASTDYDTGYSVLLRRFRKKEQSISYNNALDEEWPLMSKIIKIKTSDYNRICFGGDLEVAELMNWPEIEL